MTTSVNSLKSQKTSTQTPNGQIVLMKLETKEDVNQIGLSVLLKYSVIDYVLPPTAKLTLSSHHNTLLPVTKTIWDV